MSSTIVHRMKAVAGYIVNQSFIMISFVGRFFPNFDWKVFHDSLSYNGSSFSVRKLVNLGVVVPLYLGGSWNPPPIEAIPSGVVRRVSYTFRRVRMLLLSHAWGCSPFDSSSVSHTDDIGEMIIRLPSSIFIAARDLKRKLWLSEVYHFSHLAFSAYTYHRDRLVYNSFLRKLEIFSFARLCASEYISI